MPSDQIKIHQPIAVIAGAPAIRLPKKFAVPLERPITPPALALDLPRIIRSGVIPVEYWAAKALPCLGIALAAGLYFHLFMNGSSLGVHWTAFAVALALGVLYYVWVLRRTGGIITIFPDRVVILERTGISRILSFDQVIFVGVSQTRLQKWVGVGSITLVMKQLDAEQCNVAASLSNVRAFEQHAGLIHYLVFHGDGGAKRALV